MTAACVDGDGPLPATAKDCCTNSHPPLCTWREPPLNVVATWPPATASDAPLPLSSTKSVPVTTTAIRLSRRDTRWPARRLGQPPYARDLHHQRPPSGPLTHLARSHNQVYSAQATACDSLDQRLVTIVGTPADLVVGVPGQWDP